VKKSGKNFITSPAVITVGAPKVSLAIGAFDTHSGSSNANGIFEAVLYEQEQPVVGFRMDGISYNDTRYLNAHIDYRTKTLGGPYLQHLSALPGFVAPLYKSVNGNGVLDLSDEAVHSIRIVVKDAYGNASVLETKLRYDPSYARQASRAPGKLFYPMMVDGYESPEAEFFFGETCLYDSVHVRYSQTVTPIAGIVSATHVIGAAHIPLHAPMLVRIRPSRVLTPAEKERTVMLRVTGLRKEVQKVEWNNDWATARFRDFGSFQLVVDQEPPVIVPVGFADGSNLSKASRIVFTVRDNNTSFKNVRAELDGKWLRFTNDKGRNFIYTFDEKCTAGNHELTIRAQDEAGNVTTQTFRFTR